jgi:hypothetical protein
MKILKMSAAAVISSLVIGSASIAAWAGTTGAQSVTAAVEVATSNEFAASAVTERSWLEPSAANARPKATNNCMPGRIYSQHDLVGDPESCIMQGVTLPGSTGTATAVAF